MMASLVFSLSQWMAKQCHGSDGFLSSEQGLAVYNGQSLVFLHRPKKNECSANVFVL